MIITIDRFEGDFVVIELPDKKIINVPIELFSDAKEGDIFIIEKNIDEAEKRRMRIQDKFNKLKSTEN